MTDEGEMFKILICRASGFFGVLEERGDSARDRKKVETYVGGIILRFLQIIACNGIEIMETNLLHNVQVYFIPLLTCFTSKIFFKKKRISEFES